MQWCVFLRAWVVADDTEGLGEEQDERMLYERNTEDAC